VIGELVAAKSKPEIVTAAVKNLAKEANILSGKWVTVQQVRGGWGSRFGLTLIDIAPR
jgi:hypothetical protein